MSVSPSNPGWSNSNRLSPLLLLWHPKILPQHVNCVTWHDCCFLDSTWMMSMPPTQHKSCHWLSQLSKHIHLDTEPPPNWRLWYQTYVLEQCLGICVMGSATTWVATIVLFRYGKISDHIMHQLHHVVIFTAHGHCSNHNMHHLLYVVTLKEDMHC